MTSPHPRHLRRVIERALRPSDQGTEHPLSPLGMAVRRMAVQIQREASGRLPRSEVVDQIVSRITQRRVPVGIAPAQWPTAVLQDTCRDALPRFGV
jgi:hypothetical protein